MDDPGQALRKCRAKTLLKKQINPSFMRVEKGVARTEFMQRVSRDILMTGLAMSAFKFPSLRNREYRNGLPCTVR